MAFIDYLIIFLFFVFSIGAGIYFSKGSGKDSKSYFLGNSENKWWMLAASGAASNFSINGTVWNVAMLMVLGMKSYYLTMLWWMPLAVFLMAYTGIWIRRCNVVTSAEMNRVRFGTDRGAHWARTVFAIMVTLFCIAGMSLSYITIHKFAEVFGVSGHISAIVVIAITGVYVVIGGFKGVIWTDFIQTILLFIVSGIIGWICYNAYSAIELQEGINHVATNADGIITSTMTESSWWNLDFIKTLDLGAFAKSASYNGWNDFANLILAASLVGLIGCFSGAGGSYGEQRFLAARNTKDAAKIGALWQFLGFPRWIMTAGLAFLGFTVFYPEVVGEADPDVLFPLFLKSALLTTGFKGLIIAGMIAAYMSTFSSVVNAAASIVVKDIYQAAILRNDEGDSHSLVKASYITTVALLAFSSLMGYIFVALQDGAGGSALNAVWSWMMVGLVTCYVIPLALRWYWGRMNGWGFAIGSLAGLVPSLAMLVQGFVGEDHFLKQFSSSEYTYAILVCSLIGTILGSLLTVPTKAEVTIDFYRKVRPFGFWNDSAKIVKEKGLETVSAIKIPLIIINVVLGTLASFAIYMAPVYFLGHKVIEGWICLFLFFTSILILYFSWYKTLPDD